MRRVLLDCDPGIDDALALYALLAAESRDDQVQVQGITTVFGNVTVRQATRNVARLLRLASCLTPPRIAEGSEQPLAGSRLPQRPVHGHDGLGDLGIPIVPIAQPLARSTPLITSLLNEGSLETLIALGPLTNVAHVFATAPKRLQRIQSIVVMGGVVTDDRDATATEFNLASDPSAARCLLGGNLPLRWVPLNVAAAVLFDQEAADRFEAAHPGSALAKTITGLMSFLVHRRGQGGRAACPDAVALALALEPSLGQWKHRRLALYGRSRTGRLSVESGLPNALVCDGVDAPRTQALLWNLWGRLAER